MLKNSTFDKGKHKHTPIKKITHYYSTIVPHNWEIH